MARLGKARSDGSCTRWSEDSLRSLFCEVEDLRDMGRLNKVTSGFLLADGDKQKVILSDSLGTEYLVLPREFLIND